MFSLSSLRGLGCALDGRVAFICFLFCVCGFNLDFSVSGGEVNRILSDVDARCDSFLVISSVLVVCRLVGSMVYSRFVE